MEIKNQNTPVEEVKQTNPDEVIETPKEDGIEEPKDDKKTVGELLKEDKKDDSVPLKTFLEIKKENKDLRKDLDNIKKQVDNGANKQDIKIELKDIAEKYDVDSDFLDELTQAIYSKAKGEVDEVLRAKLQPMEDKERREKIDKAFNEHFSVVIAEMPEYADVINKDVIKELSLLPQNANKTFQQIIEETYGKTISGKKTMETSTPRGGKDASLDMSRINDPEYFKQVMANPELKKKYNEGLVSRVNL